MEENNRKMRVFLSYGHDITDIAKRLRNDLRKKDIDVWFDENHIRESSLWDESIENGILECDYVLALMSSHGFRKPSGVCLNEIAFAANHSKLLIPIRLESIPIPLLLCRIQYIEAEGTFDPSSKTLSEEAYQKLLSKILLCLANPQLEYQGKEAYVRHCLDPQDNASDIALRLQGYYRRRWLEEGIEQWLKDDRPLFLLTGFPGTGKSSLMSYLVQTCPEVKGIHFCKYDNLGSTSFVSVIKTLCYQLCTQFPSFCDEIAKLDLVNVLGRDDDYLFEHILKRPLTKLREKDSETICLIIDGLDEMPEIEAGKLITHIESIAELLPQFLKILFSCRHNQNILHYFVLIEPHLINISEKECKNDAISFLQSRYGEKLPKKTLSDIANASEGIFQYLSLVCKDIDEGSFDTDKELPKGMQKLYQRRFASRYEIGNYEGLRTFLSLLLASKEPLETTRIRNLIGQQTYSLGLSKLGDYLLIREGKVSFVHKSIADFLLSPEAGPYFIDPMLGHEILSKPLCGKNASDCFETDGYYSRFGFHHLFALGKIETVLALLEDDNPAVSACFGRYLANLEESDLKQYRHYLRSLQDNEGTISALSTIAGVFSTRAFYSSEKQFRRLSSCLPKSLADSLRILLDLRERIDASDYRKASELAKENVDNPSKTIAGFALNAIGDGARLSGDHDGAIAAYRKALSLYDPQEYASRCFLCLYNLLDLTYVKGDIETVFSSLEDIEFEMSENNFDLYFVHRLYCNAYINLSEFEKASNHARKCLEIASKSYSPRLLCQSHYTLAEALAPIDVEGAEDNLEKAANLAESLDSDKLRSRLGFAKTAIALARKDYPKTIEVGLASYKALEEANYLTGCALIAISMAKAYCEMGLYQEAFEKAQFAHSRFSRIGSYPFRRVFALHILLLASKELGRLDEVKNNDDVDRIPNIEQFPNATPIIASIKELLA